MNNNNNLEAVEEKHLSSLYFVGEAFDQIVDNAIGGSEEGRDVRNEVVLVLVKAVVPVM